jgi:hypothetical protein
MAAKTAARRKLLGLLICKPLVGSSILSTGTNKIKGLQVFFPFKAVRFSFGLTFGLTEWLGSQKPTNGRRRLAPPVPRAQATAANAPWALPGRI